MKPNFELRTSLVPKMEKEAKKLSKKAEELGLQPIQIIN